MAVTETISLIVFVEVSCLILRVYCDGRQNGTCTYKTRKVCCAHFELNMFNDPHCTRCKLGYYNLHYNSTCKPCTHGKYGTKCTKTCSCDSNDRCHHVKGCIPDHLRTTENKVESDMNYKDTGKKSEDNNFLLIIGTIIMIMAGQLIIVIIKDHGNGNVAIYMTCVAVVSILVVVCGLIVKNRKIICRQKSRNNSRTTNNKKIKQPTFRNRNKKVAESLYDDINEKYMINVDGK